MLVGTDTLRAVEAGGPLVLRQVHPQVLPSVDYSLTYRGQDVVALLLPLADWVTARSRHGRC